MNVGIITGLLYPYENGGPAVVVQRLSKCLVNKKKINITIFGEIPASIPEYEIQRKHYSNVALRLYKKKSYLSHLRSQINYLVRIKPNNFDIIHFEILPGARGFLIPLMLKLRNPDIKIVQTIHGWPPLEITFNGYGMFYKIHWYLARWNIRHFCDHIVVNSNDMKTLVEGDIKKPVSVIPNGINIQEWCTVKQNKQNLNLGYWGAISKLKGVDVLIKGFQKFKNQTDSDSKLYIIGSGTMENDMFELAKEMKIDEHVMFLGQLSQYEIHSVLKDIDICVFASRYEGFGIAILEAMAAGKCVIASNIGGIKDIIKHFENGLLIQPDDSNALAEMLLLTHSNNCLRIKLSQNALKSSKKYNWDLVVEEYIRLYRNLRTNFHEKK